MKEIALNSGKFRKNNLKGENIKENTRNVNNENLGEKNPRYENMKDLGLNSESLKEKNFPNESVEDISLRNEKLNETLSGKNEKPENILNNENLEDPPVKPTEEILKEIKPNMKNIEEYNNSLPPVLQITPESKTPNEFDSKNVNANDETPEREIISDEIPKIETTNEKNYKRDEKLSQKPAITNDVPNKKKIDLRYLQPNSQSVPVPYDVKEKHQCCDNGTTRLLLPNSNICSENKRIFRISIPIEAEKLSEMQLSELNSLISSNTLEMLQKLQRFVEKYNL